MKKNYLSLSVLLLLVWTALGGEFKFAVLADVHVSPGSANETGLIQVVEEINQGGFDFVLVPGDLTNQGSNAQLNAVKAALDRLKAPYYAVPGNHETNWSESAGQKFIELFGSERFVFEFGDVLFIGFSTGPYMKMGDGHIRSEDLTFVRDTLREKAHEGRKVVIVAHYPPGEGLSNWSELVEILKPYQVSLMVVGHWHRIKRTEWNGVQTLFCRSLFTSGKQPGYTVVEWRDPEIYITEKVLNLPPSPPLLEVTEKMNHILPGPKPLPEGIKLAVVDGSSIYTVPAVDCEGIFYGTSDGVLKKVALDGRELWRVQTPSPVYGNPVLLNDLVIWNLPDAAILALRAADGRDVFRLDQLPASLINSGRAVDGSYYIGLGFGDFAKIASDGSVTWRTPVSSGSYQAAPQVVDDKIFTGAWDRHFYALNEADGVILWRWNNGKPHQLYSPGNVVPAVSGKIVYLVAPDRFMTALDIDSGKELWRDNRYQYRESLGISQDGTRIYAKTMKGELVAVAAGKPEFELIYATDMGMGYEHNPCPILEYDGVVYAGSRAGVVVLLHGADGRILGQYQLGNSSVNGFTVGPDGAVYCSLIEGKIYRIEKDLK